MNEGRWINGWLPATLLLGLICAALFFWGSPMVGASQPIKLNHTGRSFGIRASQPDEPVRVTLRLFPPVGEEGSSARRSYLLSRERALESFSKKVGQDKCETFSQLGTGYRFLPNLLDEKYNNRPLYQPQILNPSKESVVVSANRQKSSSGEILATMTCFAAAGESEDATLITISGGIGYSTEATRTPVKKQLWVSVRQMETDARHLDLMCVVPSHRNFLDVWVNYSLTGDKMILADKWSDREISYEVKWNDGRSMTFAGREKGWEEAYAIGATYLWYTEDLLDGYDWDGKRSKGTVTARVGELRSNPCEFDFTKPVN